LHATDHTGDWVECNSRVGGALQNKNSAAAVHLIPGILEKGVKIMMFAGAEDLICNTVGIENMIQEMTWSGEQGLGVRFGV
jgi:carboxypeptidase D